jgi:hypothetical protein
LPTSTAWLLADIAEAKGKQELYTRQSPQILKALRDTAIIQSVASSNRIEGVTVDRDRLRLIGLGQVRRMADPRRNHGLALAGNQTPVLLGVAETLHVVEGPAASQQRAHGDHQSVDLLVALVRSTRRTGKSLKCSTRLKEGGCCLPPYLGIVLILACKN